MDENHRRQLRKFMLPELTRGNYTAKLLADSISPTKSRLTTFELTFPRFILSEFNTHKVLSKNSASSRAIPVTKQIRKILDHPFVPEKFGVNEAGMQASSFLESEDHDEAVRVWKHARNNAVLSVLELLLGRKELGRSLGEDYWYQADIFDDESMRQEVLNALDFFVFTLQQCRQEGTKPPYFNVHKQTANRLLEPFTWHTVIVTGTQWNNYWALRDSSMAQPEIQIISSMARKLYDENTPEALDYGQWHLPLLQDDERQAAAIDPEYWIKVVVGRCARVSYETHDGRRDPNADVMLYERLTQEGHMSPLEHVGRPLPLLSSVLDGMAVEEQQWSGNFRGWEQLRKTVANEDDYSKILGN